MILQVNNLLQRGHGPGILTTTTACLMFLCGFIADSVLLVRVWAIYSPLKMSRIRSIAVYTPIFLLITTRIINITYNYIQLYKSLVSAESTIVGSERALALPSTKIDWFLAMFQTTYVHSAQISCCIQELTYCARYI